jgi:DNA-binding transcriptional regulator YiaG
MDIEEIRHWLRMTHEQFAKVLGVSVPTLWRWRKKGVPVGPAMKLLEKLRSEMLAERAVR